MKLDKSVILIGVGGALIGYGIYHALAKRGTVPAPPWVKPDVTGPPPPGLLRSWPLIQQLHPSVQPMASEMLQRAINVGIPLVVTQSYRSPATQAALYAQGRTAPGAVVTNAPPGWSWHEFRLAFDVAVIGPNGQPAWPNDVALWARIGETGKAAGLEWGGDWTGIIDRPHFQHTGGITMAQARAGQIPALLAA